jgi:AraC family transcriptional regulator
MKSWWEGYLTKDDGSGAPELLGLSHASGESGVSALRLRYAGGKYRGMPQLHFVKFRMAPQVRLHRELPSQAFCADVSVRSFEVHPAGMSCAADIEHTVDVLAILIHPSRLTLAAAENSNVGARLKQRLSGYDDALFDVARVLALEGAADYPNGPHYWNEVASTFIDGLLNRHTSAAEGAPRGMLSNTTLARIRDYILAHLDDPIDTAALAKIAGRSPFHFSRVFGRSVGMSPHRYIVHLRLQCAVGLAREGRRGFAEIALSTGFADQSHLSRWIKRVYGISLRQLAR